MTWSLFTEQLKEIFHEFLPEKCKYIENMFSKNIDGN